MTFKHLKDCKYEETRKKLGLKNLTDFDEIADLIWFDPHGTFPDKEHRSASNKELEDHMKRGVGSEIYMDVVKDCKNYPSKAMIVFPTGLMEDFIKNRGFIRCGKGPEYYKILK
ncbi:hypothetical protein L6303_01760 [archaeon]|nr:hypothetical protein [Nanoarchaeota archaeon]MBU4452478.1 hypothetical protein [Nanoarchaeota archaeon]MCG2723445.1 hypothetical protein [archaeon]